MNNSYNSHLVSSLVSRLSFWLDFSIDGYLTIREPDHLGTKHLYQYTRQLLLRRWVAYDVRYHLIKAKMFVKKDLIWR